MKLQFKTHLGNENVHVHGFKTGPKSEVESMFASVTWSMNMIVDNQGVVSYDFMVEEIILQVLLHTYQDDDSLPVIESHVAEVLQIPSNQKITISKTDVNTSINLTSFNYMYLDGFPNVLNTEIEM